MKDDEAQKEIEAIGHVVLAIKSLSRPSALRVLKYADGYVDDEILPDVTKPA